MQIPNKVRRFSSPLLVQGEAKGEIQRLAFSAHFTGLPGEDSGPSL